MANGGVVGIRTEITAVKNALAELAAANERATRAVAEVRQRNEALTERDRALFAQNAWFEAALNNMSQGLLMVDAGEHLIVCNKRFLDMFGLDETLASRGVATKDIFEGIADRRSLAARSLGEIRAEQQALAAALKAGSFVVKTADGRSISVAQQPMIDGGWVATYEDVTERREAESRIRFLAHHDELTRLPNRVLFRRHMDEVLHGARSPGTNVALLYVDLDKFKDVNDTLGHPAGDALLKAVAVRIQNCLSEREFVARLGGDEFAVICVSPDVRESAESVSACLIAALGRPYEIHGRRVVIGASVGIALAMEGDRDGDALLKSADLALYRAKSLGRGTASVFEPHMALKLEARLEMEGDLRSALSRGEFELAYQPIFDLRGDRLCGYEALLRWRHPVRGLVSPADFVPLAEETGLITEIGAWVLHRACHDLAPFPGGPKIAVNLSPLQLTSDVAVEPATDALRTSGLDPARLELEVTETALIENSRNTAERLHRLRALGLSIVLDDFGTGYSSLSHLRAFPLSKIKIDQSFVREMATRTDSAAIVTSIVDLAEKLGMSTTAEGVETAEQLELVRQAGCSQAQGYLLGRPQPLLAALQTAMSAGASRAPPAHTPANIRLSAS